MLLNKNRGKHYSVSCILGQYKTAATFINSDVRVIIAAFLVLKFKNTVKSTSKILLKQKKHTLHNYSYKEEVKVSKIATIVFRCKTYDVFLKRFHN